MKNKGPRVLLYDLETSPLLGFLWSLWDSQIGLNQLQTDTHLLSWSAKWLGEKKVYYMDQRNAKNMEDDKDIAKGLKKLLDEADIVVGHNIDKFDRRYINTRLLIHGLNPAPPHKTIDTLKEARKNFKFTSNKLEHLAKALGVKHQKLTDKRKFGGFTLWRECLNRNPAAWREMATYSKLDTVVLEEVYYKLQPWIDKINFAVYSDDHDNPCNCGGQYVKNGFTTSNTTRYQRFICKSCGHRMRGRTNLLSKEKRASLLMKC